MNTRRWPLITAMGLLLAGGVSADVGEPGLKLPPVKIQVHTVGAFQALNQSNRNGSLPEIESGLHAALANVDFFTTIQPGIDVYADFYLSSRRR